MTAQETYINSFCKNAESLGYDPYSLAKYAMSYDKLTKSAGLGMLLRQGIGRVGQLVFGGLGRTKALGRIYKVQDHIGKLQKSLDLAKGAYNNKIEILKQTIKKQKEAYRAAGNPNADWSHIQRLRRQLIDLRNRGGTEDIFRLQRKIQGKKNLVKTLYRPIANESRKVYAARAGVGALGIGGVGLYMNKNNKENQDFGTEDYYMD